MLFNSIDFAVFLPIVWAIYWMLRPYLKAQNFFVFVASYVFYGWWDVRFLGLIFTSTLIDYGVGLAMQKSTPSTKKWFLGISLIANLGMLGFFKYYHFFLENWVAAFTFLGHPIHPRTLSIVLPVGISFYTFQTLSYSIDVYRNKLSPTKDFVAFAAFVSFFPQLVAGPIERATHLLPQFYVPRTFNYSLAVSGLKQILWGLFKKMVIADNAALICDQVFNNASQYDGGTLYLGAVMFAFQIYGDFSGYSDIAIGVARLFGFDLMQNFAFPYFSRNSAEFWRRWHISLSTWFRDYVYIPLGGSKAGKWQSIRNICIIFLVSGFWHGANWTFLVWGALNALYFVPLALRKTNRLYTNQVAENSWFPSRTEWIQMVYTFHLILLGWIFFRATDVGQAVSYCTRMIATFFNIQSWLTAQDILRTSYGKVHVLLWLLFVGIEWIGRKGAFGLAPIGNEGHRFWRWLLYALIIFCIGMFSVTEESPFIYFQF